MKKRETPSRSSKKGSKPKVEISSSLFKNLVCYLFSDYKSRPFVKKLNVFFKMVDTEVYTLDPDMELLFTIARVYVQISVEDNIEDNELIFERIKAIDKHKDEIEDTMSDIMDISLDENLSLFIENEFISRLNAVNAMPIITSLKQRISRFEKNDFESFDEIMEEIRTDTTSFNKVLTNKSAAIVSHPRISFADPHFMEMIGHIHRSLTNPKRFVRSGIKRLNAMLGGGFQPGRVYVFMATSGGWKSGLLLNIWLWGAKFNIGIRCRDQSRKPLYLYLTQENDTEESMDRVFSHVGSAQEGIIRHDPEEILTRLKAEHIFGDLHGMEIQYHPKNAICAMDIENIIRDIESDGEFEVKLLVHDYLKRLKPNISTGDLRIDLGEAANDLSTLAKALKIPVVTANQLNREAYKTMMQQGGNEHKNDLGKGASLTMQSESQMISENVDVVVAINREFQQVTGKWFLTFTDLKNRSAKGNKSYNTRYFAVPFAPDNSMRLMEDADLPDKEEYALDSISDTLEKFDPNPSDDGDGGGRPVRSGKPQVRRVSLKAAMDEEET
jgi:replicative DNA helicase